MALQHNIRAALGTQGTPLQSLTLITEFIMIYETVYKGQTVRTTSYDEAWAAAKSIYGTGKVKQINKAKRSWHRK